jgi:hypothetical protein
MSEEKEILSKLSREIGKDVMAAAKKMPNTEKSEAEIAKRYDELNRQKEMLLKTFARHKTTDEAAKRIMESEISDKETKLEW